MTFTEAALEVLRLVGKPLHYKKITEVAIERNLLSHVGKTPEVTMSSRLATMVKKDRGDAPIIKVKPGVFGLREFSKEVLEAAEHESGHEYELPPEPENTTDAAPSAEQETASEAEADDASGDETPAPSARRLPGQEVFPEEEDDDEPIFGKPDDGGGSSRDGGGDDDDDDAGSGRKKRRRRRRKRGGGSDGGASSDRDAGSSGGDDDASGGRRSRRSRSRSGRGSGRQRADLRPSGDYGRVPDDGDAVGRSLADAIAQVVEGTRRGPVGWKKIAEELVDRGRLSGSPAALGPTVAAAVRGDVAARLADRRRPRFRVVPGGVASTDESLPKDALRAERDAERAGERQREHVRKAFLKQLGQLGTPGFVELIASWLNAEGVTGLRAVRPPTARNGEIHLAGTWRRGPEEIRLAIVVFRNGDDLTRERVMEVRGSLHHYGRASAAWLVTTGLVRSGGRDEAVEPGTPPCTLFDGVGLARAFERVGIGFRTHAVSLLSLDDDLLDALQVPRGEEPPPVDHRDRGDDDDGDTPRARGRRRAADDDDGDNDDDEDTPRTRGRRRATTADDDDGNDDTPRARGRRRAADDDAGDDDAADADPSTGDDGDDWDGDDDDDAGRDDVDDDDDR